MIGQVPSVPLDFSHEVARATRDFTGREWLFKLIGAWLDETAGHRYFLITGEPGSGKTAVAGRLFQLAYATPPPAPEAALPTLGQQRLSAVHFCSVKDLYWNDPRQFASSIATQLANRYPAYLAALQAYLRQAHHPQTPHVDVRQDVRNVVHGQVIGVQIFVAPTTAESAFNQVVRGPLEVLYQQGFAEAIIILVDALDEARRWEGDVGIAELVTRLRGLPAAVRFIVTARPETEPVEHIRRSGSFVERSLSSGDGLVHSEQDVVTYARRVFEARPLLTQSRADGASEDDLVAAVRTKSGGNFLYSRLLLEMLSTRAQPITLASLDRWPDGLDEIYLELLGGVVSGGPLGTVWQHVEPILGALSVAEEPLGEAQLASLIGVAQPRIRATLGILRQVLDTDETEPTSRRTYSLFHPSLGEFLRDPDRSHQYWCEEREQHRRLARWCEASEAGGFQAIWHDAADDPLEQGRRTYARRHYVTHLYRGREWNRLWAVLDDNAFGQAKLRFDPSTAAYGRDLELGGRAAARDGLDTTDALTLLPRLWGYRLLRTSLASQADSLPPAFFAALVPLGRTEQATDLAGLVTDPARRAGALGRIAAALIERPGQEQEGRRLLARAYESAGGIAEVQPRVDAAMALLAIGGLEDAEVQGRVLRLARRIDEPDQRARLLGAIGSRLAQQGLEDLAASVISEAKEAALSQTDVARRDHALRAVAEAQIERADWAGAHETAGQIRDGTGRVVALSTLAANLPPASDNVLPSDPLEEAVAEAQAIEPVEPRVDALRAVAWALTVRGDTALAGAHLREALNLARGPGGGRGAYRALCGIGVGLADAGEPDHAAAILVEARDLARDLERNRPRSGAVTPSPLGEVVIAMAEVGHWEQALETAREIAVGDRGDALEAVVRSLVKIGQWDRALDVAREAEDTADYFRRTGAPIRTSIRLTQFGEWGEEHRSSALHTIAVDLARHERREQALEVAAEIGDGPARCAALGEIALASLQADDRPVGERAIRELQATVRLQADDRGRRGALGVIVSSLAQHGQWDRAVEVASGLDGYRQADAFIDIAVGLLRTGERTRAIELVRKIGDPADGARSLTTFAATVARLDTRSAALELLAEAHQLARRIAEPDARAPTLQQIATTLLELGAQQEAEAALSEAQQAAQEIRMSYFSPGPLAWIATDWARLGRGERALDVARGLPDRAERATTLARVGELLAAAGNEAQAHQAFDEAEEAARDIDARSPRLGDALGTIAAGLARAGRFDAAEERIHRMSWGTASARRALAATLAQAGHRARARMIAGDIDDDGERSSALEAIVRAALEAGQLDEGMTVAEEIAGGSPKVASDIVIARALLAAGRQAEAARRLVEAAEAARRIADRRFAVRGQGDVVTAMVAGGETALALGIVQQEWLRSTTSQEVLDKLPIAAALLPLTPEGGWQFYQAIRRRDDLLLGV